MRSIPGKSFTIQRSLFIFLFCISHLICKQNRNRYDQTEFINFTLYLISFCVYISIFKGHSECVFKNIFSVNCFVYLYQIYISMLVYKYNFICTQRRLLCFEIKWIFLYCIIPGMEWLIPKKWVIKGNLFIVMKGFFFRTE